MYAFVFLFVTFLVDESPSGGIETRETGNFGYPGNYVCVADKSERAELYNPLKSPLKNRTEVLCDILGISG